MEFSTTDYNPDKKTFKATYIIERYNQKSVLVRNVFEINPVDPLLQMYNKEKRKPIYQGRKRIIEIFSSAVILPMSQITLHDTDYPEIKVIEMPYWLYKKNSQDLEKSILTVPEEETIYRPAFGNLPEENINILKIHASSQDSAFEM